MKTANKMPDANVVTSQYVAYITVLGYIWSGHKCATEIYLSPDELKSIPDFTRESFSKFAKRPGDFESIIDFSVQVGTENIPFESEENEALALACLYPE
jgi:hypothetical protein